MALDDPYFCQKFVSAQYLMNELMVFEQLDNTYVGIVTRQFSQTYNIVITFSFFWGYALCGVIK